MAKSKSEKFRDSQKQFHLAYDAKQKLIEMQNEDFEFALGKQWEDKDLSELAKKGIKGLTINRLKANVNLVTGLERQNRTDWKAYPEGEEDSVTAEIATALLKNSAKVSDAGYKFSEAFESTVTCGESYMELWLDYTSNLINGKPRWKQLSHAEIILNPDCSEYDISDSPYHFKFIKDVSREDLISIFPKKKATIEKIQDGKIGIDPTKKTASVQYRDYPDTSSTLPPGYYNETDTLDLVEKHYKKYVDTWFVGDMVSGEMKTFETEAKANEFVIQMIQADPGFQERVTVFSSRVPEMWIESWTGGIDEPLADERAWYYPEWKSYPWVPMFAYFSKAPIDRKDRHYLIQGIVRGAKDPQIEHNKRRTQELAHLNSTANSGWLAQDGAWTDPKMVEDFGSTPGITLTYKRGYDKPERISPSMMPVGHAQLAAENAQDIKDILGINADLLASTEGGQSSGRAIALRQRQGIVMVQRLFDNLSRSKQIAGRFLLSQLGKMYTVATAKKVLGEAWIQKTFMVEEMNELTGQVERKVDDIALNEAIIKVLKESNFDNYDVSIGETVMSESMRMANYAEIRDIATTFQGLIPPTVVLEHSLLPENVKRQIISSIEQAQAQQAQMAQMEEQRQILEATAGPRAAQIANRGGLNGATEGI